MSSTPDEQPLKWSSQLAVASTSRSPNLTGDKILLPPSALEQLLAAAPTVATAGSTSLPHTTSFDPFNPYTFAAERQARSQLQDRQQQLPHPLTFRLVNPHNGRAVHAGIREFSADDGEVVLSPFLKEALGVTSKSSSPSPEGDDIDMHNGDEANGSQSAVTVTVHAKQLPKGTFVKLRPLEAGYDPEDWKALLERHLRTNFTTLTNGEILVVPSGHTRQGKQEEYRFLVDGFKPEGEGICVVDTDLEVDIEALNEEQARETLKRIAAKRHRAPGTSEGSSAGGSLPYLQSIQGQVLPGDYVDFELGSWDRAQGLEIELSGVEENAELDLLVNPFSTRQRAKPRLDEFVFGEFGSRYPKRIRLSPTNIELENAEAIRITIHSYAEDEEVATGEQPTNFTIRAYPFDPNAPAAPSSNEPTSTSHNPDEVQCKNCKQWIPQRTLFLHENFCLRNNILCPQGCGQVFKKNSPELTSHWHCPHDSSYGNTTLSLSKHNYIYHPSSSIPCPNPSCSDVLTFPTRPDLAQHRTSICPGKLILCQFCHLEVPQEGDPVAPPDPEVILSNLTPHEIADGGRTTECHLCSKLVRLRDMNTHLKHHDLERLSRPEPRVCRNINCGRTLDGVGKNGDTRAGTKAGQGPGNDIGLCSVCYGPLYVSLYDPEGKAMRRRVERRYLSQLLTGCGKEWCRNTFCRAGRKNTGVTQDGEDKAMSTKEAIPLVKPFLEGLAPNQSGSGTGNEGWSTPLHFCVDEASQKRRVLAEHLAAEKAEATGGIPDGKGGYGFNWCVAALEAEGGKTDAAREWLKNWAPRTEGR